MNDMSRFCPDPGAVAAWVEGALADGERAAVTAHLAACDDCRRAAALAATLGTAPAAKVDAGLVARAVRAARRRPFWRWAAAASLVAALALSVWMARPATPPPVAELPAPPPPPAAILGDAPPVEHTPREIPPSVPEHPRPPAPPIPPEPVVKPKPEIAKETPVPPAPKEVPPPKEAPPAARGTGPGKTETNLDAVFTAVYTIEPVGDLWLRRGAAEPAKVGAFESVSPGDTLSAAAAGGGFTLEGRATVVFEKGAEASVSYFKPDRAYALDVRSGLVMIDTEGSSQNWRVGKGGVTLTFTALNGRLAVEPRGEAVAALLLEGRGDVKAGSAARRAEPGREMVLAADGAASDRRAETRKKTERLIELRPKVSTAFAAGFDGPGAFRYEVAAGRLERDASGGFLRAEAPQGEKAPAAGLRAERPIAFSSGMVLRFRYRTGASSLTIRVGKFSAHVPSLNTGRWTDAEIPVSRFEHEGVPIVSFEEFDDLRFEAPTGGQGGGLDVDAIQFLRRAR